MDHEGGPAPEVGQPPVSDARQGDPDASVLTGTARALMRAFISISSDLDTHTVLTRIVTSACELTGAQHGALAVLDRDGALTDLVCHGLEPDVVAAIHDLPAGRTLLGAVTEADRIMRVDDLPALPGASHFPIGDPPMRTLLMAPIRQRGTAFGRLYLSEKRDGTKFDDHDEMLVESLATVAGFVIENARAYGISELRRRWLEMFGRLSERLTPPITIQAALERIAAALLEASGAAVASVVQVPDRGAPFPAAVSGEPLDYTEGDQERFGAAVREVVTTGRVHELAVQEDWVAVLAPLRAHLTMPGVLILVHRRLGRPDRLEEHELLTSFADQAALALDRTQAVQDRDQMAVVTERDRIARDLHDVVIQRLFATGLHMQSIRAAAPTEELRERIDRSVKELDQTIRDIRGTIFELETRPRNSVRTDVRDVVTELVPRLGFAPSVETTGPVDTTIDLQIQQQLVSVMREALNNVARHAQATTASVHLQVTPTHLRLKVADDGVGIPEQRTELGLRNARRRAALLGGNLDLWPNEPTGTIFVWSVPLPRDDSTAGTK